MGASAAETPPAAPSPRPARDDAGRGAAGRARRALARRAFADGRVRTASFALLFALAAYANVVGYEHSFPTLQDRLDFVRSFGGDASVRLFYGVPRDLLHVGGYVAWRAGGILSIFAAAWGMFAAVRALRAEEDAGRAELVLAGALGRRGAYFAALAAIGAGVAVLWLAAFAGLAGGGLPVGGSAYLALAIVASAPVFVGVGALASQLAPTRRGALGLSAGVLGVAFALRVVADTASGAGWLRWGTPLGWVEELRAFADPRPAVLLVPLAATALLLVAAGAVAAGRDVGRGLLAPRDATPPRLALLSSPTALALRNERGGLAGWLVGVGAFAAIVGAISTSFSGARLSESLQRQIAKLGASIATPAGVLGLYFLFFVFAIALFAAAQVAAARREEAGQQLETLLALPVGRRGWLAGRLVLALAGCVALALLAALLTWAGATSQGADVSLAQMLGAGANCLPAALLFLALGTLAFAAVPRASAAIAYGLVTAAFVWQLFGALLGAPEWTLAISPFHHVALVPAQHFKALAAAIMCALAAAALTAAFARFARRDLTGT